MKNKSQHTSVENLLKFAGKRITPDEQIKKEVFANVHMAWKLQNKTPLHLNRIFLVAASLFIFITIYSLNLFSHIKTDNMNTQISNEIVLSGKIQSSSDQKNWSYLTTDSTLKANEYIRTQSNDRILVVLNNGNTFRLDENTIIKLSSEEKIELIMGQIYIESNEDNIDNKLSVKTKFGSIKHIGTQYNIELKPDEVNISVRKGKVLVHNKNFTKEVAKNHMVSITDNKDFKQSKINSYSAKWQWIQNITRQFSIEGKSLAQYLDWVSNETGYVIIWDSNKSKRKSTNIKLSGSIKGLKPIESLEVIVPTTDFNYVISKTAIHISK